MKLVLNCDLGECDRVSELTVGEALMSVIDQANIACGGHAGSNEVMRYFVELACRYNVVVGAHPSYPDKANFGRKSMLLSYQQLRQTVLEQIQRLQQIATEYGIEVTYIKPHGALYNDLIINSTLRHQLMSLVAESGCSSLVLQATHHHELHQKEADQYGLQLCFEAFADRRYNKDGTLVSRSNPLAVYTDAKALLKQVRQLIQQGSVTSIEGARIAVKASTLCVHSDNSTSMNLIQAIRKLIDDN